MTGQRMDTGYVYMGGENTAPNITDDCRDNDCNQHYVVRLDGTWVRAFHNEDDAWLFSETLRELLNR